MASRSLAELLPEVEGIFRLWLDACRKRGVEVLVYCTYRSHEEQDELYARGRTTKGAIVTNAKAGQSWHNFRRAVDAVPLIYGKPDWSYADINCDRVPDEEWWRVMVEEARRLGIEWAGDWRTFKEFVHFQFTGGLTLAQAREEMKA